MNFSGLSGDFESSSIGKESSKKKAGGRQSPASSPKNANRNDGRVEYWNVGFPGFFVKPSFQYSIIPRCYAFSKGLPGAVEIAELEGRQFHLQDIDHFRNSHS